MKRSNSEVVCLQSDVRHFRRTGFTPSARSAGSGRVRLVHNDPDKAFDALIELMVAKNTPFTARIGKTAEWSVRRMASAGNRLVVLGSPAPHKDKLREDQQVRAAFRRLATGKAVR